MQSLEKQDATSFTAIHPVWGTHFMGRGKLTVVWSEIMVSVALVQQKRKVLFQDRMDGVYIGGAYC